MNIDKPINYEVVEPKNVAVDLDGFLTLETCWTEEEMRHATPRPEVMAWLKEKYKTNFIIIYTARREPFYQVTSEWLKKHNVPYHAIRMEKLPAHEYYDDRAFNLTDIRGER